MQATRLQVGYQAYWSRRTLAHQLRSTGLCPGDAVMVHASMRAVGPLLNGPDALIGALLDVLGNEGTLLCYVNWQQQYEDALDADGRVPDALKADIPPFHPATSRACRDHGVLAEFIRTTPGARRSHNPGASVAAIGGRADWFTAEHPQDYGYGPGSPFAKLVEARGKVLLVGSPLDTVSILHHAEHLARIPGKRIVRMEVPLAGEEGTEWRMIEEFDTGNPVVEGLPDDYFKEVVEAFLVERNIQKATVGSAPSVLLPAGELVAFAVHWLEQHFR